MMNLKAVSGGNPLFRLVAFAILLTAAPVFAGWPTDGLTVRGAGTITSMVRDESGGAYIVLVDGINIVVQHVTADGALPLGLPGFSFTIATSAIGDAVADGAGGVFVPFITGSTVRVVDVTVLDPGAPSILWQTDACTGVPSPANIQCASDGAGGVLVAWSDKRTVNPAANTQYKVFAQRIDAAGNALWTTGGVLVMQFWDYDPGNTLQYHSVSAAGVVQRAPGEANVLWANFTWMGGPSMGSSRLDATGAIVGSQRDDAWALQQGNVVSDGAGGAYTAQGRELDHFTSSGRDWWRTNTGTNRGYTASDGTDGALFAWYLGSGTISCQRYRSDGVTQWIPGGVPVVAGSAVVVGPPGPPDFTVAPDFSGGAVVAWSDSRAGNNDIYYQHLDDTGALMLTTNGLPVGANSDDEANPRLVSFPDGHSIVSWNGSVPRAMRVESGPVTVAIATFSARADASGVRLTAQFRSDLGVEHVNVYRGDGDGSMTPLDAVVPPDASRFEYVDGGVQGGTTYRYQIGVVDADGEYFSPVETVTLPRPGAALEQNRPNPFNPATVIAITLPSRGHATLAVYDAAGKQVRVLADAVLGPGRQEFTWDGRDDQGTPAASGVYFYRVRAGTFTATRRMVLLK
jgi:FlgD Ig-like domain